MRLFVARDAPAGGGLPAVVARLGAFAGLYSATGSEAINKEVPPPRFKKFLAVAHGFSHEI